MAKVAGEKDSVSGIVFIHYYADSTFAVEGLLHAGSMAIKEKDMKNFIDALKEAGF